jgi:predicted metalloprotease with PDZ domain
VATPPQLARRLSPLRYRLGIPDPHTHILHVELHVPVAAAETDLVMPSWIPGSYLLREFPRHVQGFVAVDEEGAPLRWMRLDKNRWRVYRDGPGPVTVRYEVYANELSVRTNHVDDEHAFVNGPATFLVPVGGERDGIELEIHAPGGWRTTTALPESQESTEENPDGRAERFHARSYAHLIDSPLEIGTQHVVEWEIRGVPHRYAFWGAPGIDEARLIADTTRIVETVASFWGGGLPYPSYTFLVHIFPGGRGGLEHRESTALHADPDALRTPRGYEAFLALVLHEFFHTWNGTRLRPEPLVDPDLTREAYTRSLWVVEGLTTYYTDLLLHRAGVIDADRYLNRLADSINRWNAIPGRRLQSLSDSSLETWIRFYRPDEHTPNAQISYYHKGALVGLMLDLHIRSATRGNRSLDDVMRALWDRFGAHDIGYPDRHEDGFLAIAEAATGLQLGDLMEPWLEGTTELPLDGALGAAGLRFIPDDPDPDASGAGQDPGLTSMRDPVFRTGFRTEPGSLRVSQVRAASPAHHGGLHARDQLVAVDGLSVSTESLPGRLAARGARAMRVDVLRRGRLRALEIRGSSDLPPPALIASKADASVEELAVRAGWLGGVSPPG